jgi:hypothetical protein
VFFSANNFAHAQTLYRMRSLVIWSYSWIYEYHAGKHYVTDNFICQSHLLKFYVLPCWKYWFEVTHIKGIQSLRLIFFYIESCQYFINKQFGTCANAFPNEFTVRSYEYCACQHCNLYWMEENQTATYFLRFRTFVLDFDEEIVLYSFQLFF